MTLMQDKPRQEMRILILEDNPADADLIECELRESGFVFDSLRVRDEKRYITALRDFNPDIILSDYAISGFDALTALRIAKENCPGVPFILVTGAVHEDRLIEILTSGATDYIIKDKLARLFPAVSRALQESYERMRRREAEAERDRLLRELEERVQGRTADLQAEIEIRKRTEEALRESESLYRTLFAESPLPMIDLDGSRVYGYAAGLVESGVRDVRQYLRTHREEFRQSILLLRITEVNKAAMDMFGVTKKEDFMQTLLGAFNDGNLFVLEDALVAAAEERGEYETETTLATVEGGEFYVRLKWVIPPAYRETRSKVLASIVDLTAWRQTEVALRSSAGRLQMILESLQAGVIIIDPETRSIVDVNTKAAEMIGLQKAEIVGRSCHRFVCPAEKENCPVLDLGRTVDQSEQVLLRGDGGKRDVIKTVVPIELGGRRHLLESFIDITERKRVEKALKESEERLQRSRRMESLGIMAGGIAHDLNNIVGATMGYSELMLGKLDPDSPLRDYAGKIMKSSERVAAIVRDMLTLARRGVVTRKPVSLNDIIGEQLATPEYERLSSYHPRVRFVKDLRPGLLSFQGSPFHVGKCLMNLLSNAAEAIRGEGEVVIRTGNARLDGPLEGSGETKPGDYVVLSVSDTGEGISPEDLSRIFEPFYTKKVMGRSGTGLGLAVVWGTVKDHEGYVDVRSEPGKGTTFSVYFPATHEATAREAPSLPADYAGRGETILVVDDIREQREIASAMLRQLNYNVITASSGLEALERIKGNKVDLVVLDMLMEPGLDGLDTYRLMVAEKPRQKAVLVSGMVETERVESARKLGAGPLIKKPYLLKDIGLAIRRELDRK